MNCSALEKRKIKNPMDLELLQHFLAQTQLWQFFFIIIKSVISLKKKLNILEPFFMHQTLCMAMD